MGLFGVHLLILQIKFQFSKCIKSSTFHIFLNLTYIFLENNVTFPKDPFTCPITAIKVKRRKQINTEKKNNLFYLTRATIEVFNPKLVTFLMSKPQ